MRGEKGRKGTYRGRRLYVIAALSYVERTATCRVAHTRALTLYFIFFTTPRPCRYYDDAIINVVAREADEGRRGIRWAKLSGSAFPKIKGVERAVRVCMDVWYVHVCVAYRMDDAHPKRQLLSPS